MRERPLAAHATEHGAAELRGLDLSPVQIGFATDVVKDVQPAARVFESPMEENPGSALT
jgi:hypothetical protein